MTIELTVDPSSVEVEVNLRPTVGRQVCLGVELQIHIFVFYRIIAELLMWESLSDERTGL
jgi:hypothetical protein